MQTNNKMREAMVLIANTADCLEASLRRDNVWDGYIQDACNIRNIARDALAAPPEPQGDVAKMREALIELRDIVHNAFWSKDGVVKGDVLNALRRANVALAAPARNCDKYPTAKDAKEAFISHMNKMMGEDCYGLSDLKHNIDGLAMDYADWLLEEIQKGDNDADK